MRSYEKKPTLRMVDGGMFGAVKSMFSSAPPETITQKFARQDAEFRAKNPAVAGAPAVAAPPAPAASAPSGIPGYVGNSTLDGRMKAAGLRDGGTPYSKGSRNGGRVVGPGDGTVDTVDAKYANGEYVLPADTALAIGHDRLDALKDATHTPVALQRAYDGRSNGGQHGQEDSQRNGSFPRGAEVGESATLRGDAEMAGRVARYGTRGDGAGGSGHAPLGLLSEVRKERQGALRLADGGRWPLDGELRSPNIGPDGSAEARTFRESMRPAAAPGPVTPPAGRLRSAASAAGNFLAGAGESAGSVGGAFKNVAASIVPAAKGLLKGSAALAAPLSAFDGFNTETETYAKRLGLENTEPGLARDIGVRALGLASDVGNNFTGGLAKKYLYRDDGSQPGSAQPTLRNPEAAIQNPTFSAGDATMPGQDSGRSAAPTAASSAASSAAPTLRNPPGVPLAGAPGVFKLVQNGKTSYSNVPGDQGSGYGVSVVPGMSREQIDSVLNNPNGTRWSAGDNAIMDANRRDGVDPYRGTSRDPRNDPNARLQELAYSPKGTPGRKFAQQQLESQAGHAATLRSETLRSQTTMRGQDIASSDHRYTADSSAANAKNSARAEAESKQRAYDLDIAKFGEEKAKTMFNQREQSDKDLTGKLESMFTTPDDKGNAVVDRATVASHKAGVYSYIANTIDKLSKVPRSSPDYARSQQTAEALRSQSTSALGPDRLEKLITQLEVKKRSAAASGVGPFSGSHTDSSDPSAYDVVGKDSGLLQDQYTLRNGSRVPARALDYDNGGNPILPNSFGNRPTDRFNLVKKDLRNGN